MKEFIRAFPKIGIVQLIAVGLIILYLLTVRLFFKGSFKEAESFYNREILSQTSAKEVLY